ncbi:hypothetical protein [Robertkochia sediminum]|uniref:hypothetical protein n=1 Tax=Robertkochia sediminum TaxID=2785326 RepID=UPI001933E9AA|nr:hypothetical protein [Robertkochia sediminum]MBL7473941.1 hypothetical protein [Robertkochia sediminum]
MIYTFYRYSVILVAFVAFAAISCGRSEEKATQVENTVAIPTISTYAPLEELYVIDPRTGERMQTWKAFWELEKEMKNFRATESGDLGFITDELIRLEATLINDSTLEKVNIPAVKSRVLVFRTFTKKLKDQLNHRVPTPDIDTTRFKILEAYNAFRYQVSDALRDKVYEDFLNRDSLQLDTPAVQN